MKFGLRTPSLKRRIAARTSWKRVVRHSMGLKAPRGMGMFTNPKRAMYNKVYNKTSFSIDDIGKGGGHHSSSSHTPSNEELRPGIEINNTGNIIRSSSKALTVTSKNFEDLRAQVSDIYNQRQELLAALGSAKTKLFFLSTAHFGSYLLVVGFFYKGIAVSRTNQQAVVKDLEAQLAETYVKLTFADKSQLEKSWLNVVDAFNELMKSEKIWDMTYAEDINRAAARTVASTATKRIPITPETLDLEFIKSDLPHLYIPNANGADLFFFPTFLILFKSNEEFGIFDIRDINASFKLTGYIEEETVPKDTEVIQHTWKKANKDGSADKRFKGNYQIPIVKYGDMTLKTESGLEESYMFSNFDAFVEFGKHYEHHFNLLKTL